MLLYNKIPGRMNTTWFTEKHEVYIMNNRNKFKIWQVNKLKPDCEMHWQLAIFISCWIYSEVDSIECDFEYVWENQVLKNK